MSPQPAKAPGRATDRPQRRHPRYRAEFPVEVGILSGQQRRQLYAHCRDLSEAGIGVLVAADLTLGEVASLSFTLPGMSRAWEGRAVLRHRRGYHYGFEFLSLADSEKQVLAEYLSGLARADSE